MKIQLQHQGYQYQIEIQRTLLKNRFRNFRRLFLNRFLLFSFSSGLRIAKAEIKIKTCQIGTSRWFHNRNRFERSFRQGFGRQLREFSGIVTVLLASSDGTITVASASNAAGVALPFAPNSGLSGSSRSPMAAAFSNQRQHHRFPNTNRWPKFQIAGDPSDSSKFPATSNDIANRLGSFCFASRRISSACASRPYAM